MSKIIERTLEVLQEKAEITADLIDIVLAGKTGYMREARRSFLYGPRKFKHDWAELYKKRQSFYSLLTQLKRDGLITKKKAGSSTFWHITRKGVNNFARRKQDHLREKESLPRKKYFKNPRKELVIVSFDVPEKTRGKRDWLRSNLVSLGFEKLQKSVWIGTHGVPREFINDLRTINLLSCVHILSVGRRGTIAQMEKLK